jgi:hypothetical protein
VPKTRKRVSVHPLPNTNSWRSGVWVRSSCGWQSVNQFIWVSGLPLGPLTRFYLALLFRLTVTLFFVRRCPLWRENGSSLQCNHSLVRSFTPNHTFLISARTTLPVPYPKVEFPFIRKAFMLASGNPSSLALPVSIWIIFNKRQTISCSHLQTLQQYWHKTRQWDYKMLTYV